ncbi:sulfotransferase family protein [Caulobacter sp. ErkDOM-E]|uniref:sulfotransferase family protein n=1 Tax=Caulobacter sp. ErkDOM-E TaxID=3402778 RepID=UPI003AF75AFF
MAKPAKTAKTTTARRALVVAGMHRSGTSAMARLLSLSGATLPERVMAPAADNPAGFWEPWEMVALNDRILASFDSSWDDVFTLRLADHAAALKSTFLDDAKAFVKANYGAADLLVIKDPRASVLAPFWREALTESGIEPLYVIMVRNPLAVAQSLSKRNAFSTQKSVLLWTSYMLAVERDTRGFDRLFVDYDAMLDDWRTALAAVESALGQALPRSADAAAADIDGFLHRSLRHHEASSEDLSARADVWSGARIVFEWFEAAARGKAPPAKILDAVAAEILALDAAMGEVCADMRRDMAQWQVQAQLTSAVQAELDAAGVLLGKMHAEADAARQAAEGARIATDEVRQHAAAVQRQVDKDIAALQADVAIWRQRAAAEQSRAAIFQRSRDQFEREFIVADQRAAELQALAQEQAADIAGLRHAVWSMQTSTSWRLTAPLRRAILLVRRR